MTIQKPAATFRTLLRAMGPVEEPWNEFVRRFSKYRVTDAAGNNAPAPARPPPRR